MFVTRGSAGATAADRRANLALPPNNSATYEGNIALTKDQVLLEGKVAPQLQWGQTKLAGVAGRHLRGQIHRSNDATMNIRACSDLICDHLTQSSFQKEADEVRQLTDAVLNETASLSARQDAAKQLISRCHVKWLGDYFIVGVSYDQWLKLLTQFSKLLSKV
ncbi:hypothetical protein JN403_05255 [Pseudomonas sp. 15A4]|uniref:hypothetical protein n=2 Tax=unclassified Pseudomonas TaxID=196821 RepID=UPI00196826CE|nr:hypothetical protein [Pseudomonas sp. 15A4]QSB20386.1 hypothetical protein JN403_05255 [Pseudomonas sp. 15A4]